MKQIFSLAAVTIASFLFLGSSCNKSEVVPCTAAEPSTEEAAILAYATLKNYTVLKHSSGIYYQIVNPGTGNTPTATSNVRVQYTGKLLNDSQFDANTTPGGVSFNLSGVIQGWTIGIPLIKSGGVIRLLIPSKYGYGCTGSGGSIPANSPLYFEVSLLAVF
ncbi:MAG: FKBP-type peptidyl-prolyl cis-trans isomerase [Bacteroidota bacterium]